MNEEEIRAKLLLPYLNDLGFDVSEISLEKSFSIRLGKSKHIVNGRSDILCTRNGKNLFIIELKNHSVSINQHDIDQGISYSRLLDNIAPFTIISNGKTTKIFDSITRKELTGTNISEQSSFWQNEITLSTDIDLRIRYEALKNFVSFSAQNLKIFCEIQVKNRIGPLIGNIDNHYAKFVKEVYVERHGLQNAFDDFMSSDAKVFGIVGSAGVGKTNAMCSLALQKLENEFVFFYNAAIINKSPLEHITQDLNGAFSTKSESEIILKKLNELGRFLNRNILIFIDGIDENVGSDLAVELSEIALTLRNLERVKLCVSCKSNIWNNILKKNGTVTHLFEELNKFHNVISSLDDCPGFLLEDFSNDEIQTIVPLYKKIFGFKGEISESLFKSLKNGFFLRIFNEVYSQREVPKEIYDKDLMKRYIYQSLEKTHMEPQFGLRILAKIGSILMEYKYTRWAAYHDDGLEIQSLLEKMELSLQEHIPVELFARSILIKSNREDSYNITFYYSKIRDYIICFHSYKLDKLSDQGFYDVLEKFYENHIGQSAISFYLANANDRHKRVVIKFKQDKCLNYVITYESYLDEHFKKFREKFNPETDGSIGIFLSEDLLKGDGYGLFPLEAGSANRVQYVKFANIFLDSFDRNIFYEKGVKQFSSSTISLLTADQSRVVRHDIFKQLKEIIAKGRISVYSSDILLLEQVSTIVYYYSKKLGYGLDMKDYYLPRFDLIYPLNLKKLRDQIRHFLFNEYFNRENIDPTSRKEKIDKALLQNHNVPKLHIIGDFPPFEELFKIVEILLSKGYNEITKHHLPYPDVPVSETTALYERESHLSIPQIRVLQFSEQGAKLYIEQFLRHFETCYKDFVESYFPTFKNRFPFFMDMPHEYFIYLNDSNALKWGLLGYRPSSNGDVQINFKTMTPGDEPFENAETKILRGFSLDQILHNDYNNLIKTVDKLNTPKLDEFCIIRNWVYSYLKEDLKTLFEENTT